MLPATYQGFGNIREVFPAVFASLKGEENDFKLPKVDSAIVIMVDGLGWHNLAAARELAPTLHTANSREVELRCGFPSSTVASITSLASASTPAQHGMIGYRIYVRAADEEFNLLSGMPKYGIRQFAKLAPLSTSHRMNVVTLPAYDDSGFSDATMRGATHYFEENLASRVRRAAEVTEPGDITYLYVPELDQAGHAFGWQSPEWREQLVHLEHAVAKLHQDAAHIGIVLIADHGVVDVDQEQHLMLNQILDADELLCLGGDPRAGFIYLKEPSATSRFKTEIASWLGARGQVLTQSEVFELGLYGLELQEDIDLLPELFLLPADGYAVYHRELSKVTSMRMIGQHGGVSSTELDLPLVRLGAYSSSDLVP